MGAFGAGRKAVSVILSGCLAFGMLGFAFPSIALADEAAEPAAVNEQPASDPAAPETGVDYEGSEDSKDLGDQPSVDVKENKPAAPQNAAPSNNVSSGAVVDAQGEGDAAEKLPEGGSEDVVLDGLQQDEFGYRYGENGAYILNTLKDVEGSLYYFGEDGYAVSGLKEVDGKLYFFDEVTFVAVKKAWKEVDGKRYRFGQNCFALGEGSWKVDDKLYYINKDCTVYTGWKTWANGTKSYFSKNNNGSACKGWWTIGGKRYYFKKDTHRALRGSWLVESKRYFFNADASQYKGWIAWKDGTRSYFHPDRKGSACKGWWTIGGSRYYFKPATHKTLRGYHWINGNRYNFKNNGAARIGWVQWSNGKYSYFGKTGIQWLGTKRVHGVKYTFVNGMTTIGNYTKFRMCNRAQQYSSKTNFLVLIDTRHNRLGIFKGSKGNWYLHKYWSCSTGKPSTPTPLGIWEVGYRGPSFCDKAHTYTCYWYTQIYKDYLFHSVPYYYETYSIMEPYMGQNVSHGCIRLWIDRAKWIYNNVPRNTKVTTYRG